MRGKERLVFPYNTKIMGPLPETALVPMAHNTNEYINRRFLARYDHDARRWPQSVPSFLSLTKKSIRLLHTRYTTNIAIGCLHGMEVV